MADKKTVKIALSAPIKLGGGEDITEITLAKPTVGALRGLMLAKVQMQDVGSLIKLIPRIAQPLMSEDQVSELDPADFAEMANTVSGFFVSQAQLDQMRLETEQG